MIAYMTSTSGSCDYLPYAHNITAFIVAIQVDLRLGGRPLTDINIVNDVGMATLKAMKYSYIRIKGWWIREEDIFHGEHCEGFKSPYETNPPVDIDEHDYLDYSFLYLYGDGSDDEGDHLRCIEGYLLPARLARDALSALHIRLHLIRRID
ncbi:hypothetical protein Scep_007386 [Stephania cephalantha]|uniref:Uncharacterized protein n=1 Tax=Stephania cephalantha TaxID=152367 RepID=A0AAP0PN72_9MAGN